MWRWPASGGLGAPQALAPGSGMGPPIIGSGFALGRPRVVQAHYTPKLKSSGAVLPGAGKDIHASLAAKQRPWRLCRRTWQTIGPGAPPMWLGLDPESPDSLARGYSSRVVRLYQLQNESGLQAPKLLGENPRSLNKGGAGANVNPFAPNRRPRSAPGPSH